MILTDHEPWAKRARYLTEQAKDDPVDSVHGEIGFNYRMTSLSAALGVAQLEQLNKHVAAKRRIAASYSQALANVDGVRMMAEAPWATSNCWLLAVRVSQSLFGCDRRALHNKMAERGIQTRPLWQPLHHSPAHAASYSQPCPVAEEIVAEALCLPSSVNLSQRAINTVCQVIRNLGMRPSATSSAA